KNHIFFTINHPIITVFILSCHISSKKPVILKHFFCLFFFFIITFHVCIATSNHFPYFPCFYFSSGFVDYFDLTLYPCTITATSVVPLRSLRGHYAPLPSCTGWP